MRAADEVVVTYRDKPIRFEPIGGRVEKQLRTGYFYEHWLLDYIAALGLDGSYVDVGAYVGTHAMFFAAHCRATRVHAFEPHPRHFETLRRHVERNRLGDRVVLHQNGVSDREESVRLRLHGLTDTIACRTLDQVITEPVSLMKIDVEGMEDKVLAGAQRILRESKPLLLVEGKQPGEIERHLRVLAPLGYRLTGRVFNSTPTYELVADGSPTAPPSRLPRAVPVTAWTTDHARLDVQPVGAAGLRLTSRCSRWWHADASQAPASPRRRPEPPILEVDPTATCFLQAVGRRDETMKVTLLVTEYDQARRTSTQPMRFHPRLFRRFTLRPDTRALRVSIRVRGPGVLDLERIALHVLPGAPAT